MPRIKPSTIWKAFSLNKALPFLLPECRSISAAKQELHWIENECTSHRQVVQCCKLRYRHYPLQYILRSQPFGPLSVKCERGVLIPRWETEEWTMDLAQRLPASQKLQILDLCTGTGCVALLLKHLRPKSTVHAIDCSPLAFKLVSLNASSLNIDIQPVKLDILDAHAPNELPNFDIITCNPPYIPKSTFVKETSRSVKLFEPKLALIGETEFYSNLLDFWLQKTDAFVYEVGELSQCTYIHHRIAQNAQLSDLWRVGFKFDSNRQARVVFGYKRAHTTLNWEKVFEGFGELKH
ncbi:LAME_0D05820g1_1 [Lachancea meyersii CBS 8951]|uniref:peptide chain release factor N(5)-glutamine methyltransferase n=1 Tax=Lachancea meyersii CBS 8951 TaxID=1266667 RepID=A0A1G4J9G4_9SACH|nr:LAME_0D05820g1_1 [Lachancea meyersii CBS 8951]